MQPRQSQTFPIVRYATTYDQVITVPRPRNSRFSTDEAASLLASCRPCELAAARSAGVGTLETGETLVDAALESGAATQVGVRQDGAVLLDLNAQVLAASDAPDGTEAPEEDENASGAPSLTWRGPVGVESVMTGDGRMIESNALRWEDATFPQPLRHAPADIGAHGGAVRVGSILGYERQANGEIVGFGTYDLATPMGREAARQAGDGQGAGVSMDLDDVSFEIRVAADLLAEMDEDLDAILDGDPPERDAPDADGRVTVVSINSDDEVMVTTSARIRAVTQVDIPAFSQARINLEQENWAEILQAAEEYYGEDRPEMLAASAAPIPVDPPAAWFQDPGFTEITPLTITDEGRVFGHLAAWGSCHTGDPMGNGQCITPPSSPSNYSYFLTGALITAEGSEVRVGQITMDTLHAGRTLTAAATMAHYEQTGLAMADITVGEDGYGIWFSGALRPGVTPEQRRILRASPLSGDWRRFRGRSSPLELVAALSVNVQGYPVPRPQGLVASGSMISLVASGMVPPRTVIPPGAAGSLSLEDLRYLKRLAAREKASDQQTTQEANGLARRIAAAGLMNSIRQMASTTTKGA